MVKYMKASRDARNVWSIRRPAVLLFPALPFQPNFFGTMSLPSSASRHSGSSSNLQPHNPMSAITSQQRTQWRWQNLQRTALACELFITLLHIVIFSLDPSQARLLDVHSDLSHLFDPRQPWPEERYAILLHLYRLATTAREPVLELSSDASRLELWKALHQLVILKASPLTAMRVGSVRAVDIHKFLNRRGKPMHVSDVRHWTHRLWHTLPFHPPWHFTSAKDMTLAQEGQVTTAMGALQGILEQVAAEPAFDPDFLTPIAISSFPWATSMLQGWAQTAQAAELAFQAAHRLLECRTDRQGLVFLVVMVLVHHFLWGIPSRAPVALVPPELRVDFSEASFHRSLEALTAYIELFSLRDVIAEPVFVRVQHLLVDMSPQRVKEWRDCLRGTLSSSVIDDQGGNESGMICSGKEADLTAVDTVWFRRPAPWWRRLVGDD